MISAIELQNVRIFEGDDWKFNIRPLTLFCGTNSSGKSTILKSLLLLKQSQSTGENYSVTHGKLRLTGNEVDFGDYRLFVSNNNVAQDVTLVIGIDDYIPSSFANKLRPYQQQADDREAIDDSIQEQETIESEQPTAKKVPYSLRAAFTFTYKATHGSTSDDIPEEDEQHDENGTPVAQVVLQHADYTLSINDSPILEWHVSGVEKNNPTDKRDPIEVDCHIKLPKHILEEWLKDAPFEAQIATDEQGFVEVEAVMRGLIPGILILQLKTDDSEDAKLERKLVAPLPNIIEIPLMDLRNHLKEIHYLDPLRAPPERYYMTPKDSSFTIDSSGGFLPYVLREAKNRTVVDMRPEQRDGFSSKKRVSLDVALNVWLHYLRTGFYDPEECKNEIDVSTIHDILTELKIKTANGCSAYALADSGFGYSQLLPILVQGLLMDDDGILIVEQPELHLNPALQVRLAEFFVVMALAGKQVLLETHSEHIVNAIRVLTAEDESDSLFKKCAMFFIDAEKARPIIHDFSIKPDGTVANWPPHFFGEAISLTGRLLRAQKRFRLRDKQLGG